MPARTLNGEQQTRWRGNSFHDSQRLALALENRTLLNVQLDESLVVAAGQLRRLQAPGEAGGSRPRGAADLQQMLGRLPTVTLADLQKGDAVMLVSTQGSGDSPLNVITLLTGVEPILTAAPSGRGAAMLLSPWNLGSSGGEAATE